MLALILQHEATPMAIGSRLVWLTLAGMIMRPRATSDRTSSGDSFSRRATYSISCDDALAGVAHLSANLVVLASLNPWGAHIHLLAVRAANARPYRAHRQARSLAADAISFS